VAERTLFTDNDPFACAWLRNLIAAGHLGGTVLERDIDFLNPTDLAGYPRVHLFAGIAGWELALRLAGWPAARPVWTGSCPCQPFSSAGKRKGTNDRRHLWPEMFRLVKECRPPTVLGEQVASADGRCWLAGVFADLEGLGYACAGADLCAAGVGAPHIRQRLFWVADAKGRGNGFSPGNKEVGGLQAGTDLDGRGPPSRLGNADGPQRGQDGGGGADRNGAGGQAAVPAPGGAGPAGGVADAKGQRESPLGPIPQGQGAERGGGAGFWAGADLIPCRDGKVRRVEPGTFPLAARVPGRVGMLCGYGNAVVPQVAALFVRAYLEAEDTPDA
jgi:DNA (cytosine-5)-methyltransferase 1